MATPVVALGKSMTPTLPNRSVVFVNRLANVSNGDIVACIAPDDPNKFICKRITHIEGDLITIHGKQIKIPKNHIFIQGDNPTTSYDSRYYGPISKSLVQGKVVCTLYPSLKWL